MPQVKKAEVDRRIREAALQRFAAEGYASTSMTSIASAAGMAPANIYRYYTEGKRDLLEVLVTDEIADTHERLITARVRALLLSRDPHSATTWSAVDDPPARRLLEFWVAHRLEVIVLLDRASGTRFQDYGQRFVDLLVALGIERLRSSGTEPCDTVRDLFAVVFDNTRRALVEILTAYHEPEGIRRALEGFWSYQLPGLEGLYQWATSD